MRYDKPWDETWHVGQLGVEDEDGVPVLADVFEVFGDDDARLAAAAPDLVRALLATEWIYQGHETGERECPWCMSEEWQSHDPACVRQAALRKAGVL